MTWRPRIYIAGPYTQGDKVMNVRRAMELFVKLMKKGYHPMIPHTMHYIDVAFPGNLHYERIMQHCLENVALAQAVYRLPGESPGADRECIYAAETGKAIFTGEEELLSLMPPPPVSGE